MTMRAFGAEGKLIVEFHVPWNVT